MRCLKCHTDGLSSSTQTCPHCGVHLPSLLRDVLPSGTLLRGGAYRIDYALGRGGFGITYRAMHTGLERLVAIKEFYPQTHAVRDGTSGTLTVPVRDRPAYDRWLERFVREGRILAQLSHPNVVRVTDLFEERGTAYLVMELVEGHSLRQTLDSSPEGKLPEGRVRAIVTVLVAALDAVHAKGVFHLDVKPENVLETKSGDIVLVDFGAARRAEDAGGTSTQAFAEDYAPLEIFTGEGVGPETDLYQLAVVVHELLSGARPPRALARLRNDTWTPARLGEPWEMLLRQALALERDTRPKSVSQWWKAARTKGRRASAPSTKWQYATLTPCAEAEAGAAPDGIVRTSIVISGVPGFARALALQRAFQQVAGVTEAKAVGYERGILGLEVQHAASADLAAQVANLPGIHLRVVEASPGQLQLSAEG